MNRLGDEGVRAAWRQEPALVRDTGRGARQWEPGEVEQLLRDGKIDGYHGDHINNVASRPELAGDPNNIQFLTSAEHHTRHMGNGGYQVPTEGELIY